MNPEHPKCCTGELKGADESQGVSKLAYLDETFLCTQSSNNDQSFKSFCSVLGYIFEGQCGSWGDCVVRLGAIVLFANFTSRGSRMP